MFRFLKSCKKIKVDEEIIESMSSTLGHNLRTSFVTIQSGLNSINKILPDLISVYKNQNEFNKAKYNDEYLNGVCQIVENSERELSYANYYLNKFISSTKTFDFHEGKTESVCFVSILNKVIEKHLEKGMIHHESIQLSETTNYFQPIIKGNPRIIENCISYIFDNLSRLCKKKTDKLVLSLELIRKRIIFRMLVKNSNVREISGKVFSKYHPVNKIKFGDGMFYAKNTLENYSCLVDSYIKHDELEITIAMINYGAI